MKIWPAFFFVLFLTLPALAQDPNGAMDGTVTDPSGAVIANAAVTVTSSADNVKRSATTHANGRFAFTGLPAGKYWITVEAPAMRCPRQWVNVRVGQTAFVGLKMQLAAANVNLDVREENAVDRSSSVLGNPVTEFEIENTPLANRSFANIAYIAPMTAPVEPSDPTKARITAVSFAGSSGLNVDLSVDGGDNNDDYIGGFLQNYTPEAIREFNVRTAQFEPDTSRTNGGSVVISTRSGGNDWHGSASSFFRASALNARNTIDNPAPAPKQPYQRQDYVGAIGGPLRRNRLWYFASYEYNHEIPSVAYSSFSQSEFQSLSELAAQGEIPGITSIAVPTSVTVPFGDSLLNSRMDWQQSPASRWFLRFSLDRSLTHNDLVQQSTLPSTGFTTRSNYYSAVLGNTYSLGGHWLASTVLAASIFDHSKARNSQLGFALAFPFSTTALTTSGFETFGDNQFATAITAFPIAREQQKYQFRYDLSRATAAHTLKVGVNLIHEPVLRGRFADTAESVYVFPQNPSYYTSSGCPLLDANLNDNCPHTVPNLVPATNGTFSQSVRRLGFYGQDSWRISPGFALNYGLRYDTTFGLFIASGHDQNANATLQQLRAAGVAFANGIPHDYRGAVSPRLGAAWSPRGPSTVLRAGLGLYYNDLAQNGWAQAFQAVNGGANLPAAVIDPHYHSPYAIQASAAVERALGQGWRLSAQFEHQQGVHQYRRYQYVSGISLPADAPSAAVFRTDNRSRYDGGSLILQHRAGRLDLTAHYTFSRATTWGATVGELFDYVNGVTNALHPFGPGDHGPSGEDMRHRFVVEAAVDLPGHFRLSTLAQFESARPYTMFTPVDINGDGNVNDRAVVNGVQTSLDEFRGSPYSQIDLRVSREFRFGERLSVRPLIEMFNLLNRQNAGNNYVPDISALPTPVNNLSNATAFCLNADCSQTRPIHSINDLRVPAGALGDFFGPGTTVGVPFAAQAGVQINF
jgi:hypothetical protein